MVQETLLYVISLLFAVMLLVILGQKLKIAYPIFLVIGGLLISLIPGTPRDRNQPGFNFPDFSSTPDLRSGLVHILAEFLEDALANHITWVRVSDCYFSDHRLSL